MRRTFRRDGGGVLYRRRSAVECVNSRIKRNLGSALRSRTDVRREREMLFKALVHNLMLLRRRPRGETKPPLPHFRPAPYPVTPQLPQKCIR